MDIKGPTIAEYLTGFEVINSAEALLTGFEGISSEGTGIFPKVISRKPIQRIEVTSFLQQIVFSTPVAFDPIKDLMERFSYLRDDSHYAWHYAGPPGETFDNSEKNKNHCSSDSGFLF